MEEREYCRLLEIVSAQYAERQLPLQTIIRDLPNGDGLLDGDGGLSLS